MPSDSRGLDPAHVIALVGATLAEDDGAVGILEFANKLELSEPIPGI
jgi:hypothetical protein